eukprot:gene18689-20576_t
MADEKPGGTNGGQSNGFFVREKCTREELKIAVNVAIERFRQNEEQKELCFPSSLTSSERAYVHLYCRNFGLKTRSHGRGNQRALTVYKKDTQARSATSGVGLSPKSEELIGELLRKHPVTNKEKQDLSQKRLFKGSHRDSNKAALKENKFALSSNPQVPPKARDNDTSAARAKLPIYGFREKLLKSFKSNQVTLVTGDTGCGKTTQVGQYILEDATKRQQTCKAICTQPRRISAISVADRVAHERGEQIGHTVGYQIRLEARVSSRTCLLYCTNGVLLRLLMIGHKALNNITHVIIDEIHERDKFSDYLLICLRDQLKSNRNLKVILMSAALNVELFKDYFGNCPVVHVPTMCHKVESYFLEDILLMTGYMNKHMKKLAKDAEMLAVAEKNGKQTTGDAKVESMIEEEEREQVAGMESVSVNEMPADEEKKEDSTSSESFAKIETTSSADIDIACHQKQDESTESIVAGTSPPALEDIPLEDMSLTDDCSHCLDPEVRQEMDASLKEVWEDGNEDAFDQIIHLILNENVHVDYQHSETSMTALMIAAARGYVNLVEQLVEYGADAEVKDHKQGWTAVNWARNFNQGNIVSLFENINEAAQEEAEEELSDGDQQQQLKEQRLEERSEEMEQRLELYHSTFDDDKVDHSLIMRLIEHVCESSKQDGAILIFLPGYDDIVGLRDRLALDREFSKEEKYIVYPLHSMMQPLHQRKVFRRPPSGVRKIILSTNIAETSVTIDDVTFVIDSGKVKEKSFEALTSVSALRSVWISKASALQRRGRAGRCRPGQCYHLMSRYRFHGLALYQEPELLRTPVHELCLQTKFLSAGNVSIGDFLAKAPEAPPYLMIQNSIALLKSIDALDDEEELTELGKILVDLPIDPRLGKMILFGIVLKCLDAVLIIASCLAYRDPFVLPISGEDRRKAYATKTRLGSNSLSDHIVLLRAYEEWSKARDQGFERSFCNKNFLSSAAMEMISGMKSQLMGHLRSLGLVRTRHGDMKELNANSGSWPVVKAALLVGVYPAMLRADRELMKLVGCTEKNVRVHPSSVLYPSNGHSGNGLSRTNSSIVSNLPYDWVYYDEMSRMHVAVQVRCLSVIPASTVALLAGSSLSCDFDCLVNSSEKSAGNKLSCEASDSEDEAKSSADHDHDKDEVVDRAVMKVDEWISFHGDDATLELLVSMKMKLLASFFRKISSEGKSWSQSDDAVIQCVANVLALEEGMSIQTSTDATEKTNSKQTNDHRSNGEHVIWSPGNNRSSLRSFGNKRSENSRNRDHDRTRSSNSDRRYDRPRGGRDKHIENEAVSESSDHVVDSNQRQRGSYRRKNSRYFIVKCNNYKNLDISMSKGIWATTKGNEKKLDRAFREAENVYLIFSIQGSGNFQGYARMLSGVTGESCPEFGSTNLGNVFSIQWVCKGDVAFHFTQDLVNPWNENKKVQISRDGQELESSVGEALCSFWNQSLPPGPAVNHHHVHDGAYRSERIHQQQQTQALDHTQAYAVVDGHTQPQMFIADPSQAAMYNSSYASPADVREMPSQYHPHAVYPAQVPGFPAAAAAPPQLMQPRYQSAELYQMHSQSFVPYRRQGNLPPRGVHYYPPRY